MDTRRPENVIFSYDDEDAVEDGFLVAVQYGPVNRVTRAVFDHFTTELDPSATDSSRDVRQLSQALEAMLKLEPDGDGWRTGTFEGKMLWLIPNEIGGLTLLFPDDY
jgi:hypothetical protein